METNVMPVQIHTKGETKKSQIKRYPVTKLQVMDEQHQKLLDKLNELIDLSGKDSDPEKAKQTLNEFSDLLIEHFGSEEKYMTMSNYPDKKEHFESHKEFLTNFILRRDSVLATENPMDLHAFSREIAGHINSMDKKVSAHMIECQWPT